MESNVSECRRVVGVRLTRQQGSTTGMLKQAAFSRFIGLTVNRVVTVSCKDGKAFVSVSRCKLPNWASDDFPGIHLHEIRYIQCK
jgi:hypothetical protein